ncbi:Proteophosphoglycan ppg4 [Rhodotorula toruloides]|nr:Proteophosphoglycan ppg4 [Rhodotorula toruloides]
MAMDPTGDALLDPTTLSAQGKTDALVEAVEANDLLALVLVLQYAEPAEVNGHASSNGRTPLETALSFPTFRSDIRSFAIQGLLHCGAVPPPPLNAYAPDYARVVREWESGGREQAVDAFQLVRVWTLEQVDAWIEEKGLGVDEQPGASVEGEQPTTDGEALASTPIPQPQAKEEPASPTIAILDVSSAQPHEVQDPVRTTTTSPAPPPPRQGSPPPAPPPPVALSPPAHDPPTSRRRSQAPSDASKAGPAPPRASSQTASGSSRPRVLFTGLPKHVPLEEVCKLVRTEIKYYPEARFTTSRQPDAVDAIVELRNDHEVRLVLRRLNGVFLRNRKVGAEALPPPSAEAPSTGSLRQEERGRGTLLSPRRRSSPPPTRRERSPSPHHSSPRQASPSTQLRRAREPSDSLVWLHVSNLSRSAAERDLYELLARARLPPEDVYVHHAIKQPFRFAFVGFSDSRAAEDAMDVIGARLFNGQRPRVSFFRRKDGETQPFEGRHAAPRFPYAGPARNQTNTPAPDYRDLIIYGIAPYSQEQDLRDFIEAKIGRGSIRRLHLEANSFAEDDRKALLEVDRHSDALRALDRVDGSLFKGQAITVNWAYTSFANDRAAVDDQLGAARSSRSPTRHSPSPLHPASSHAQPPASPSQPPPSPPQTTAAVATKDRVRDVAQPSSKPEDLDALRYLGLPPPDLEAISQMWAPLDEAPLGRYGKPFDRHLRTKIKFGFVPQQDAEAALQDERMRTVFKDDPVLQQRFEVFLAAQAGRSKDWYLTFFAHIAEFNRLSRLFSETARRDAAKQS